MQSWATVFLVVCLLNSGVHLFLLIPTFARRKIMNSMPFQQGLGEHCSRNHCWNAVPTRAGGTSVPTIIAGMLTLGIFIFKLQLGPNPELH